MISLAGFAEGRQRERRVGGDPRGGEEEMLGEGGLVFFFLFFFALGRRVDAGEIEA